MLKFRMFWLLPLLLLLAFVTPTKAAQFKSGDYTLEQSEIIEENLYIADSQTINISGVVDGDLFLTANTITISGTITGNLFAAGSTIDITGNVYGNAYLAGQKVDVSGNIAQNITTASMYADISGTIGKDVMIFANNAYISGQVMEDARVFASSSTIYGIVNGETMVYASTSSINRDLVNGEVYENLGVNVEELETPNIDLNIAKNSLWNINIFSSIISFIAMYIVGIVIIYLAPVKALKIEEKVTKSVNELLYSFLVGLGISIVIPLPLIILAFTFIGTPLALLLTGVLLFIWIFGRIWVESAIGHKILEKSNRRDDKRLLSLLIGRGITTVISFIPIVRGIYKWVLGTVAIGAVIRMKYDCFKTKK